MADLEASAEREDDRVRARRTWGRWLLCTDTLELVYEERPGRAKYFIDLERMNTSAAMLDWIFQLCRKRWVTPTDAGNLVRALQDIFNPQARLCSLACTTGHKVGQTIDASAYLRARYGASS
jgi:hypothetical protein